MSQKKDKVEDSTPPLEDGLELKPGVYKFETLGGLDGEVPVNSGEIEVAPALGVEPPAPALDDEPPAPAPKRSHKKRGPYNKREPYRPQAGHTPPPEPEAPEDPVVAGYRLAGIKAVAGLVQLGATLNPGLKPQGEGELMAMNAWMAASGNLFVKHRWRGEVSPELAFVGAALSFYGAMMTAERNRPLMERARDLAKDAWVALRKKFGK